MDSYSNISEHEVEQLINYEELLPLIETAFGKLSMGDDGGVVQPVRSLLPVQEYNGWGIIMPCYYDGCMTTKVFTNFRKEGLQSRRAMILLYLPPDGAMKALIAGETITLFRTAAMSAVATKVSMVIKYNINLL
ncbi:ketimine reductase mu-crystallin-like [Anneissia japonica]|uniref:ketimine reductase mu-crystallin-like n=1 Tax=Anneissia japonica TaxID=1529436 RepID=UPI001425887B|nr:ketimine reductase mu-crystallin-like [Anneissia japonica]XP_033097728.1 ketimine reductase mu-crystallin-like [Anneissia japonica]XP_033097729.1 ketimine reductase mu-crystallin-like [Anneissia japonica]